MIKNEKVNIVLVQPYGYSHSLALQELGEFLKYKLENLGLAVTYSKNRYNYQSINVILGAHLLETDAILPTKSIIFNTEQLEDNSSMGANEEYRQLLEKNYVWDYSPTNTRVLSHDRFNIISLVFDKKLNRLKTHISKEYDLIFYGSMNSRREKLINELTENGIIVQVLFNIYAEERDRYLEKSRAVLNLHYYESQIFQQVRCFYPLNNSIPVLSEDYPEECAPSFYDSIILKPNGVDFVEYATSVVTKLRSNYSDISSQIEKFKLTSEDSNIEKSIEDSCSYFNSVLVNLSSSNSAKSKINLGSGKDYKHDYLNIDINELASPDLIVDLSKKHDFPIALEDGFGNPVVIQEGFFEEIVAIDVLAHVNNLSQLMTNCLKLLVLGGKMQISVSYDLSLGAWQGPTHVRSFNQNSWLYYTEWFWDIGWFEYCFDLTSLTYKPSEYGGKLIQDQHSDHVILSTPRAIDSMDVVLTKRKTSIDEKTQARILSSKATLE